MRQQPETIGEVILLYVKRVYGTQVEASLRWSCSPTFLNQVIKGERRPTQQMLDAIQYRHVETWVPRDAAMPAGALPMALSTADIAGVDLPDGSQHG